MSHPITTTVTLAAAVANGIALAQSVQGGANAVLNGSLATDTPPVANLGNAARVTILSSGNDSANTFTIHGYRWDNTFGSEVVTGTNGATATSQTDFLTVTRIFPTNTTAGTITVGRALLGSGPWVVWDAYKTPQQISFAAYVMGGSPNFGIEYTYDDPFGTWLPPGVPYARPIAAAALTGKTASFDGTFPVTPIRASRLTVIAAGTVQLTQIQGG